MTLPVVRAALPFRQPPHPFRLLRTLRGGGRGLSRRGERGVQAGGMEEGEPAVLKEELVKTEACRWIGLKVITWRDPSGKERKWESCERTTKKNSAAADAVAIFARLYGSAQPEQTLLVAQFRPPINASILELPAGLIDEGETPEQAALRELREETGYVGTATASSPIVFSSPGMTNESLHLIEVDVDLDRPENVNPVAQLEEGEFIERFTIPRRDLMGSIEKLQAERGFRVDARLYGLAAGMRSGKR